MNTNNILAVQNFLKPGEIRLPSLPPLSLYIHFPWCIRKCPYCDFNSHEWKSIGAQTEFPETSYLKALRKDLEQTLPTIWGRQVHTVFIGGGTPSLLSVNGLERLLSDIRALLPLDPDAEITMEANPGTFEAEKFRSFREIGINRLSIGIQSFNNIQLKKLGRIHDGNQARRAIEIAKKYFNNFNLDLMFGLPQQTLLECQIDIETAIEFSPPHLSLYHLTIETNTQFYKYPPSVPDEDICGDMQDWIIERTMTSGYERYEVSAYAQPNQKAKHNLNYWEFGDYLGIGAGAHNKLSFQERVIRQIRYKHPKRYMEAAMEGNAIQNSIEVSPFDLPFEFMLNVLRLTAGVKTETFANRTGLAISQIAKPLAKAVEKGLLVRDPGRIAPTALGQRFLNDLQTIFLNQTR
ncbi:radical SAM family heme chaperone HemW [Candidatus Pandoraea novymonadis]|uniref:Heme chaperone HemW n=1 Tax=Candidatus Pandoraea novymonadis TaxID=1808959 RepID=A0ABX5FFN2_9BURK|nr:radical SAM family heme chaperone HemW [Candidatus Pandoraea novymonadis]PSB91987.1 Oxygen-independent coproporphyrinogen-III oxidase-like protein YqeR [Candidatus Pandoraea novymonadis]